MHTRPPLQLNYDKYGLYLTVGTICVGASSQTPGPTRLYAFDKLGVAGLRRTTHVPYWDVTNGLGSVGASITALMPARPQGKGEVTRDLAFFAAQVGTRMESCPRNSLGLINEL